jgi:hypothetical protein
VQAAGEAPASTQIAIGNISMVSDYRFRGISQTFKEPALQGGIDYSHASGGYLGTWASNVYGGTNASGLGVNYFNGDMEWEFYGGYKWKTFKGVILDAGLLYYWYPGAKWAVPTQDKYNSTEVYLGAAWNWLTVKYSYALSDYFGMKTDTMGGVCGINSSAVPTATCMPVNAGSSKGSSYLDIGVNYDLGDKLILVGHIGHASVRRYSPMSYTDWKIGVTKEWAGLTWGASYIDTDAKADVYRTAKIEATGPKVRDTSNGTLVLSVRKTF